MTLFDDRGVTTLVDTQSRTITPLHSEATSTANQEEEGGTSRSNSDFYLRTVLSRFLKFQLLLKPSSLGFSCNTHVTITPARDIATPRDVTTPAPDVTLQRELLFLRVNFNTPPSTAPSSDVQNTSLCLTAGEQQQSDLPCCPICSDDRVTCAAAGLQVTCSKFHVFYLDPGTREPVDPFRGVLCAGCGTVNSHTGRVCGMCHSVLSS